MKHIPEAALAQRQGGMLRASEEFFE